MAAISYRDFTSLNRLFCLTNVVIKRPLLHGEGVYRVFLGGFEQRVGIWFKPISGLVKARQYAKTFSNWRPLDFDHDASYCCIVRTMPVFWNDKRTEVKWNAARTIAEAYEFGANGIVELYPYSTDSQEEIEKSVSSERESLERDGYLDCCGKLNLRGWEKLRLHGREKPPSPLRNPGSQLGIPRPFDYHQGGVRFVGTMS